MRFVLHTQYYLPELGAPQSRLSSLASGLIRRGHEVTVLTAMPNYPMGRVFYGYGGILRIEEIEGVRIVRTAIFPSKSINLIPRLLNYFSFVFSSLIVGSAYIGKPDVILTESPPLFLGISGYLLSRIKRSKWIFNVSDLWPESAVRIGALSRESFAYRLSLRLEEFFYKKAWVISGQSKGIIENIQRRFPNQKVYHFSNGVLLEEFQPYWNYPRKLFKNTSEFMIVYAGLHGLAQGLGQVLEAAVSLQEQKIPVQFVFVGEGPEKKKLIEEAKEKKLLNVTFLDAVPKQEVPELLASADAILVSLRTTLPGAIPSKLYEAMAIGRPVILIANGEAAEIVQQNETGVVVSPGDIGKFIKSIQTLISSPDLCDRYGKNGRRTAEVAFNRRVIVDRFVDFVEREFNLS